MSNQLSQEAMTAGPGWKKSRGIPLISQWQNFEFYNLVWYWDERKADMADDPKKIRWWLGIAHRVGSDVTTGYLPRVAR